jgi:Cu+-exporting ATPase
MQVIRQNMWFTFLYSGLSIPLAADILYPFTSVAMSLSSLSVILNSLRLKRFK